MGTPSVNLQALQGAPRSYRLGALLGSGGEGWVFSATRVSDGLTVALKVVPLDGSPLRSAAAAGPPRPPWDLRHIVTVYEQGRVTVDRTPLRWFALERCDETLQAALERDALPTDVRAALALRLLRVLAVLHRAGVVHRDVKSENLLLTGRHELRLADLGLASAVDELCGANEQLLLGTLLYLSPESLQPGPHARAHWLARDQYAAAIAIYQMLSGSPKALPFAALGQVTTPTALQEFYRSRPLQIAPLQVKGGGHAPASQQVLQGMLALNPAQRPSTCGAAEESLTLALAQDRLLPQGGPMSKPQGDPEAHTTAKDASAAYQPAHNRAWLIPMQDLGPTWPRGSLIPVTLTWEGARFALGHLDSMNLQLPRELGILPAHAEIYRRGARFFVRAQRSDAAVRIEGTWGREIGKEGDGERLVDGSVIVLGAAPKEIRLIYKDLA